MRGTRLFVVAEETTAPAKNDLEAARSMSQELGTFRDALSRSRRGTLCPEWIDGIRAVPRGDRDRVDRRPPARRVSGLDDAGEPNARLGRADRAGGDMKNEMKVFSGNGNPGLARAICHYLHLSVGEWKLSRFSDGEVYCQILENVRGTDVFVIQPTCHPVNENLMELLIAVDALKRSSAARITAVIPYYGYARQDRKDKPRVPISAKLVADLLTAAGVDRLLTMELHAPAIQGFFNLPVDHLFAAPVLLDWVERQRFENLTIVSPDAGGVERARAFAKKLEAGLVIVDKRRVDANVAETMNAR
jgi:hypothetical protein